LLVSEIRRRNIARTIARTKQNTDEKAWAGFLALPRRCPGPMVPVTALNPNSDYAEFATRMERDTL